MQDLIEVHTETQITDVADLARKIWQEHYVPIVGQKQVDYMLAKFQSKQAIADQIADTYKYYLVVQHGKNLGYMAIVPNKSEASIMLSKIYVKKEARGLGYGRKMLEFVEAFCRHCQLKKIWLTVNKNNSESIGWYSRMGFINTASLIQDIGGGFVMDDYRMEKIIGQ